MTGAPGRRRSPRLTSAMGSSGIRALLLAAFGLSALAPRVAAEGLDLALYGRLLTRHTESVSDAAGVRVDYRGLMGNADWKRLVEGLSRSDPSSLSTRPQRLAFWINAYNILAIDLVAQNYPVTSIRQIGSLWRPVWKRDAGNIDGEVYSLGEIEHKILRAMGEPRIHAAIVCASTSCPSLRREPYAADRLDLQLDDSLRRLLADPRKGARLDRAHATLHLSSIFDWFAEDFPSQEGVLGYLSPYLPLEIREWLAADASPRRIRFLDYDWSLNDAVRTD